MATLTWNKKPGRVSELTRCGDMGIYAVSSDGRFRVYVHRRMAGDKGARSYRYTFAAYDTLNKKDLLFTAGECQNTYTGNPKTAFARCEQEAAT